MLDDLVILLLGIYLKKMKMLIQKDTRTPTVTAASFTTFIYNRQDVEATHVSIVRLMD